MNTSSPCALRSLLNLPDCSYVEQLDVRDLTSRRDQVRSWRKRLSDCCVADWDALDAGLIEDDEAFRARMADFNREDVRLENREIYLTNLIGEARRRA